ncbi:MAG: HAMP domain-containing histidine kinase [Archangium sp.]|nr:HAMP domain-containing histidine kinase [Archangium sp.]
MQLARKITLPLALFAFVALGASAWISVRAAVSLHHADLEDDQRYAGRVFLAALERERARGTLEEGQQALLAAANKDTNRATTRILPFSELKQLEPSQLDALARGEPVFELDVWHTAETWMPVTLTNGQPGVLWIHENLAAEKSALNNIISNHAWSAGGLAMLWAVVAIWLGAVVVGRPMRALAEKARRVSKGDYSGPVTIGQADEIGELAREMNHMCEELEAGAVRLRRETLERETAMGALRHADRLTTVGLLAAGLAHELGTPLNVVSVRAKMIALGEVAAPDDIRASAEIIHQQSAQMTRIIRQLLDFARRSQPAMSTVKLDELVQRSLAMLQPLADKAKCRFVAEGLAPETLEADPNQLQQALTNLVVNAIQAMPQGGAVHVSVARETATPPADVGGPPVACARLDVRDEGPGIPKDVMGRVFEPFFTTKPVGDGNGLGLPVAWGIVRDHRGWISIASPPGAGATFSLFLPLERVA